MTESLAELHVTPCADRIEHETNDDCPCGPTPMFEPGGIVYAHQSLDNRESEEPK